jgi:hypothetical protein
MYPKHLWIKKADDSLAASFQDLSFATNLNTPHLPGHERFHIIYNKSHAWIALNITVFLSLGKFMTANVYCIVLWVVPESDWYNVWLPIATYCCYPSQTLALQVLDFGRGKGTHHLLPNIIGFISFVFSLRLYLRMETDYIGKKASTA